nr:MAG TPA: hypothetical protein [Caudoviricetes sp.]
MVARMLNLPLFLTAWGWQKATVKPHYVREG